jgi:hypothetical protein
MLPNVLQMMQNSAPAESYRNMVASNQNTLPINARVNFHHQAIQKDAA